MTPDHQTPLQELGERVAKLMGWRKFRENDATCWAVGGNWPTPSDVVIRRNPSDPAEILRLCAEFNVWPQDFEHEYDYQKRMMSCGLIKLSVEHDNTPASRLEAATRAALLAVEMILKNREGV